MKPYQLAVRIPDLTGADDDTILAYYQCGGPLAGRHIIIGIDNVGTDPRAAAHERRVAALLVAHGAHVSAHRFTNETAPVGVPGVELVFLSGPDPDTITPNRSARRAARKGRRS